MNKCRELYYFLNKKGIKNTLIRMGSRYFHIITFILYKRVLNDSFSGIILDPDFTCIDGDLELLNRERVAMPDLPREFYIDKTHGSNFFYVVYYKDKLAHILWVIRKGEYSRFFDIQDEATVEINYIITLPKFRGNRLQAKTINYVCEDLRKKGYKMVLCAVSVGNILSIKGLARTGLKEFERVKSYFSFVKKQKY